MPQKIGGSQDCVYVTLFVVHPVTMATNKGKSNVHNVKMYV